MSISSEFIKKVEEAVYPADQYFGGGYMPESDEEDDKPKRKRTFGDPWYSHHKHYRKS